jgi:hypothetical protein
MVYLKKSRSQRTSNQCLALPNIKTMISDNALSLRYEYFPGKLMLYILRFSLSVSILLIFPYPLKSQNKLFERSDNLNNDSIIKELKDIEMREYLIREDHHSPQNRRFIFQSSREFSIVCMFEKSCLYSFADSSALHAVNKIFGYSFGSNHHNNSFRIGWRCKDSLIEVLAYWYIKRERFDDLLFVIKPGKRFFINAKIECEKVMVKYQIEDMEPVGRDVLYNPEKLRLKKWGYVNFPYFGGISKAPNDMVIYLKAWMCN